MNEAVKIISPTVERVDKREVLRYAGVRSEADKKTLDLLDECLKLADGKLQYKICYKSFPVDRHGNIFDLGFASVSSDTAKKRLDGCKKIILFASTVGIELDRLILRYSAISPARAHMLQAIGTERIEALCDAFEELLKTEYLNICPRFSVGYGDLPLGLQKEIFGVLDCPKNIGLTLNESLLMSPTKSVTAIIGIKEDIK